MTHLDDARLQIDEAISMAVLKRQPCHIQIACNLATIPHPTFQVCLPCSASCGKAQS